MGVNELAVICKTDKRNISDLWLLVYRLIVLWARRYCKEANNRYELDDLTQSAYFALLKAIDDYKPESGYSFTTFLRYHCKNEFRAILGIRTSRREPPSLSLDFPITEGDGITLGDTIPCGQAAAEMEAVDEGVYNEQLRSALDKALATLPEVNRQAVQLRYYEQKTYDEIADTMCLRHDKARRYEKKALRMLRRGRAYQELKSFDYYGRGIKHTSHLYFRYNLESSTEAAALASLEREERYKKLLEYLHTTGG